MQRILSFYKNIALDLFSMMRGFTYGFFIFGLFMVIMAGLLYGILFVKNIIL